MLVASAGYKKLADFQEAHPDVEVTGDGFFTLDTYKDLQKIIDQTATSLKSKRYLTSSVDELVKKAKDLLEKAGSKNVEKVTVRWGLHQDEKMAARGGGNREGDSSLLHFTVRDPGGGNDWHLYVGSSKETIIRMSQGRDSFVEVANV